MHLRLCVSLLALSLVCGCEVGVEPPSAPASRTAPRADHGQLRFVEGYAQGYHEARRQGKPMLVFFTASWCTFCKQMAEEAFTNAEVVNLSRQFVCVLVDADAEPAVCQQFQVSAYPTLQFVSPRGVALERVVGKKPGHQVMMAMQAALQHVARRGDAPSSSQWR